MDNKQIIEEVYKMCCNPFERCDVKSFIEEEWQKEDEIESTLDKIERKERGQKRHRGLVIGEDGTVKSLE